MPELGDALINAIRTGLAEAADPLRAPGMQAYMKSAMPYLGVSAKPQDVLYREVFKAGESLTRDVWTSTVLELWRNAEYREERYAAIALTGRRAYRPFQDPQSLPLYEELIVTGAWWDYVDAIASGRLGVLLRNQPSRMKREMLRWSKCPDMWKRRSAILCQLGAKRDTDLEFLYACIEPSLDSKEFFLRKAIGWALRQYAWTDPAEVARYVKAIEKRLSPLSKREALKNA